MGGRENNVLIQMGGQELLQACLSGTGNSYLCDVFHKMPVLTLLPLSKSLMEILNSANADRVAPELCLINTCSGSSSSGWLCSCVLMVTWIMSLGCL